MPRTFALNCIANSPKARQGRHAAKGLSTSPSGQHFPRFHIFSLVVFDWRRRRITTLIGSYPDAVRGAVRRDRHVHSICSPTLRNLWIAIRRRTIPWATREWSRVILRGRGMRKTLLGPVAATAILSFGADPNAACNSLSGKAPSPQKASRCIARMNGKHGMDKAFTTKAARE